MHLCILILGLVLFPQAYTLNCFTCVNGFLSCREMQCPAEKNQCGAIRVSVYNGNSKITDVTSKSCFATKDCLRGSINFGLAKTVFNSECCTSNLCNKNAPDHPKMKPNGKKCYQCDEKGDCSGTVNCEGNEDQCIKTSVTTGKNSETLKGCATKNVCLANNLSIPGISTRISCCEGNYCNGVSGLSASLLLLAAVLMSTFFLSK